ncbi:Splicing factor 3B subunit 10 (SF3b10) domain containing protein [Elaphomyces granulatus]
MADKLRTLQNLEALQARYIGTGHADTTKYEWVSNILRDSYSSYIGHPPLLSYMAVGLGEPKEKVRAMMIDKMIRGAGNPPELGNIFRQLRTLRHDAGNKWLKRSTLTNAPCSKSIATATEFNDLRFSALHHGSTTYVKPLRSFLEHDNTNLMHRSVFTHGDVRADNIMVKRDPDINDRYVVTGIIDWEFSGFYPAAPY